MHRIADGFAMSYDGKTDTFSYSQMKGTVITITECRELFHVSRGAVRNALDYMTHRVTSTGLTLILLRDACQYFGQDVSEAYFGFTPPNKR